MTKKRRIFMDSYPFKYYTMSHLRSVRHTIEAQCSVLNAQCSNELSDRFPYLNTTLFP